MYKPFIALVGLKNVTDNIPVVYNRFSSKIQLTDKRRAQIEERRGQLKIETSDPPELKVVIEGILNYKPSVFTLDDRYFQLEQILDAIDRAKNSKQIDEIIDLCAEITKNNTLSPSKFKNTFQEHIDSINLHIQRLEDNTPKSKL